MRFLFFLVVLIALGVLGTIGIYLRFLFILLSLFFHFLKEGFLYLFSFPELATQKEKPLKEE